MMARTWIEQAAATIDVDKIELEQRSIPRTCDAQEVRDRGIRRARRKVSQTQAVSISLVSTGSIFAACKLLETFYALDYS